ncbi:hypothetical protein TTRE_0000278401 [Trichuris trichiura]|uniref:GRIP domain-containing protein n=1 Tax=Trichuris trichiura TaxID=36087 RepID=A0A077Z3S8_TRITR|nr:hypothetical protein TTRE_0000278401 [Trichuris trichiura]
MSNRSWLTQGLSSLSNFRQQLTDFTNEVIQEVTSSNEEDSVVDLAEAKNYIRYLKQELAVKSNELESCVRDIELLRNCPRCRGVVGNLHRDVVTGKETVRSFQGSTENLAFDEWNTNDALTIEPSEQECWEQTNVVEQFSPTAYEIEIRRLKDDLKQLKAECLHWKTLLDERDLCEKKDEIDRLRRELQVLQERDQRHLEEIRILSESNRQLAHAQKHHAVRELSSTGKVPEDNCWTDDWGYAANWDEECEKQSRRSSGTECFDLTAEGDVRRERKSTESATDEVCDTDWREQIQTIQQERDQALEELDREHQEAINQLLSSKEALAKTCDGLREQNIELLEKVSFWKLKAGSTITAISDADFCTAISNLDPETQLQVMKKLLSECRRVSHMFEEQRSSVRPLVEALCEEAEQLKNELKSEKIIEAFSDTETANQICDSFGSQPRKELRDSGRTIEEYENIISDLTEKIKRLEMHRFEDDVRNDLSGMQGVAEAFRLDTQQLVHNLCKKLGISESKELEIAKYLSEMGEETFRREDESTSWQWLMPRSPDNNGEVCSVDMKTLHSASTTTGSFSAPPSDEFGESPTLLQSQAKAIEELNEKNHFLAAKLKSAEDLSAYQSTVISFLRQSVESGFKQLQRTMHLLGRYRYYVGGVTSSNIESIDSYPYVNRKAIEYPHDRIASAKSEHYVFPAKPAITYTGRKRAKSVGPIVYRPKTFQEDAMSMLEVRSGLNESIAKPDVPIVHDIVEEDGSECFTAPVQSDQVSSIDADNSLNEEMAAWESQMRHLREQLDLAKKNEKTYRESWKEAIRSAEQEKDLLSEKYNAKISDLQAGLPTLTEQLERERERESGSKSSTIMTEKDRELKMLKDDCEKLSIRLSFLENVEVEKEKMESKVTDLETHLVTMYADREQLIAAINEHYRRSAAYQTELQEIAKILFDDQEPELEEGRIKLAVETLKQSVNSNDPKVAEMQAQLDRLNAEVKSLEGQSLAFEEQLRSKDEFIASLQAQHAQCEELRNKVPALETARSRAVVEVERLKSHLMEIEINYNQEACKAEDRETNLRSRLHEAENRVTELTEMVQVTSEKAAAEFAGLHGKLVLAIEERDSADMQRKMLQSELDRSQQSLHNLQNVLVTFQEEKATLQQQMVKKFTEEIDDLRTQVSDAKAVNQVLEEQISQQSNALQRLCNVDSVLASKDERMASLESEVVDRERRIMAMERQIEEMRVVCDGKIDKDILKNLLMGYFTAPAAKKSEVVHLIGSVLGFSEEEFSRIKNSMEGSSGWLNFLSPSMATAIHSNEQSLVGQFVKFLETESSPKPEIKAMPLTSSSRSTDNRPSGFAGPSSGVPSTSATSLDSPVTLDMPVFNVAEQHIPAAGHTVPVSSSADFLRQLLNSESK